MDRTRFPGAVLFFACLVLATIAFCSVSGCTNTVDERGKISVSVMDPTVAPAAGPSATQFIIYTYDTQVRISNLENTQKCNVVLKLHGSPATGSDTGICTKVEDRITVPVLQPMGTTSARVTFDRDSNACMYDWTYEITSASAG